MKKRTTIAEEHNDQEASCSAYYDAKCLHHKAAFASFAFSTPSVVAEDYSVRVPAPDSDLQSDFGLGVELGFDFEQEAELEPEPGSGAGAGVGFVSVALA